MDNRDIQKIFKIFSYFEVDLRINMRFHMVNKL